MKGKLIILVGMSNAGKSTYAADIVQNNPNEYTRVNRDDIRNLLFGYNDETISDYYERPDIYKLEKQVTMYEDTLIYDGLEAGKTVIVDSTNLKRSYLERYKYWNVQTEVKFFDVMLKEALIRNKNRSRQESESTIKKQYNRYVDIRKELEDNPIDFTPVVLENTLKESKCWVFDIDGCLAHHDNKRSPFDWHKVGQDRPDQAVVEAAGLAKKAGAKVIICTGRDGVCIDETEQWLETYEIPYDEIYIRPKGDSRADWIVKEEFWRRISKNHYIFALYDDRNSVVRRARALGLKVFNVEYGNF